MIVRAPRAIGAIPRLRGGPQSRGLVAAWPMAERGGNQCSNAVTPGRYGLLGQNGTDFVLAQHGCSARLLSASSQYFTAPDGVPIAHNARPMSISVRIRPYSLPAATYQVICGWSSNTYPATYGTGLYLYGSDIRLRGNVTGTPASLSYTLPGIGEYTITAGLSPTDGQSFLAVNGVIVAYGSANASYSYAFCVGAALQNGPGRYFNGELSDLRLYDRLLSDQEVRAIHLRPHELYAARRESVYVARSNAIALVGWVAGTGRVACALTTQLALAGSVHGAAVVSSRISTAIALGAAVRGVGATAATLRTVLACAAHVAGSGRVSARLGLPAALSGRVLGVGSVRCDLVRAGAALRAVVRGDGAVIGRVTTHILLGGSVAGAGAVQARLSGSANRQVMFYLLGQDGQPLAGVTVRAVPLAVFSSQRALVSVDAVSALTDVNGRAVLELAPSAHPHYRVMAEHAGCRVLDQELVVPVSGTQSDAAWHVTGQRFH